MAIQCPTTHDNVSDCSPKSLNVIPWLKQVMTILFNITDWTWEMRLSCKIFLCGLLILLRKTYGHIPITLSLLQALIDKRLVEATTQLVREGITDVGKILLHLRLQVKMFVGQPEPDRFNRRYYPERRDISDMGYRAKQKLQEGVNDLALLETLVKMLRDDVYRAHDDNQLLMLIPQTEWQRRLLLRYGNTMVFLCVTYKTTCYIVPLYQLTVMTNVGYIHVTPLIMQREDTESIKEVLHVITEHNTSWSPRIIMIDADEKERVCCDFCLSR